MTTIMTTIRHAGTIAAALLFSAHTAHAVCGQTAANLSTADAELFASHGCDHVFFTWEASSWGYDLHAGDWTSRGWFDACNIQLEFPKHWNAAYLVARGMVDNHGLSFHGVTDYLALSRGPGSAFHDGFYHNIGDRTDLFGWYFHFAWDRAVNTFCPLYDIMVHPNANPASRAGNFMHEGWHAWLDKYGWDNGSCGGHRCTGCPDATACDYFYFHGIGRFAFGDLWVTDGTAAMFHSPNQIQVEFLCDVADLQPHLPRSVRDAAAADANRRATRRFINGPGYRCGDPRPW